MTQNQKITLATGQEATMFVPDLNDGRELAIVDMAVLQRLADMLPKANINDIVMRFSEKLADMSWRKCTLEQYIDTLKNEVAFHETVNIIATYKPETQPVVGIVE